MGPGHRDEQLLLRLPIVPSSVPVGRRAAAQFAEEAGLTDAAIWGVRVAVSEALSNAVLHAYAGAPADDEERFVEVLAESLDLVVRFTVSDAGIGLTAGADSSGIGLGFALIARACDELAIDTGPAGGTSVRIDFRRSAAPRAAPARGLQDSPA